MAFFIIRALVHRGRQAEALTLGVGLLVVSFLLYGPLVAHATGTLVALLVDSAGLALVLALTQIIVLRSVPARESGMAVGLSIVMYAAGNSLGSALTGSLFSAHVTSAGVPSLDAYRLSFLVSGVAVVLALVGCWALLRQNAARRLDRTEGQPA